MYIPDFHYHRPRSVEEACRILGESPDGVPLAGGTDLLVEIKQGKRRHQDIVSLSGIKELKTINMNGNNLEIGAAVTHNELIESPVVRKYFSVLSESASQIGTDQIRNTGTIGGNLCTGASCSDIAPILVAVNAEVELVGTNNIRRIPVKNFFIFHRKTAIEKGEILTRIIISDPKPENGAYYEKFGLREAASIAVASAAALIELNEGICTDACIVLGAVAPTPKICTKAREIILGKKVSELSPGSQILQIAGEAAAKEAAPIDDIRGSAAFRRELVRILTQRAVSNALSRSKKN